MMCMPRSTDQEFFQQTKRRRKRQIHVMSQSGKTVVNTEYVDHYSISAKNDAVLVMAGYHGDHVVTLGRYKDEKEAVSALSELYTALIHGRSGFNMPDGTLFAEQHRIMDARTKRKGGS